MNFKFAKATDITEYAFKNFGHIYERDFYSRIFITPDVQDVHILRIVEGFNREYEREPGRYLLEWQKIPKSKYFTLRTTKDLDTVLEEDDGSNWDYKEYGSLKECMEQIDGGFGFA